MANKSKRKGGGSGFIFLPPGLLTPLLLLPSHIPLPPPPPPPLTSRGKGEGREGEAIICHYMRLHSSREGWVGALREEKKG